MQSKYILPVDIKEVPRLGEMRRIIGGRADLLPGLLVNGSDDSELTEFYRAMATIGTSFVIIVRIESGRLLNKTSLAGMARRILPFILDVNYLNYMGDIIIGIDSDETMKGETEILRSEFQGLGFHKLSFKIFNSTNAPEELRSGIFEELFVSGIISDENPAYTTNGIKWVKVQASLSDLLTKGKFASNATIADEAMSDILQVENFSLKNKVAVLERNLFDLNNYYRFVRGETTFKYHNRDENMVPEISPNELTMLINTTIQHPVDHASRQLYYETVYEKLPGYYKKLGTIIKLVTGRCSIYYLISKKQKQIYIDFLKSLPEEKRVDMWYYYEYEILPAWYKRLGKKVRKKRE